jgi:DNA-directed RNA polymerase
MVYLIKETTKLANLNGINTSLLTLGYTNISATAKSGGKQYVGICKINEDFIMDMVNQIEKRDNMFIQLERSLPMIYKPAPWADYDIGGYYQKPTNIMRIQNSRSQEQAVKHADMAKIFHVLDIVGAMPWRINKKVLNVVEKIWEEGGGAGEIPPRFYDFKDYVYEYQLKESQDLQDKKKLIKKIQLQRDVNSLRCDFTLKLTQAKAFSKVSKFYYPHNVDFRGRMYPIPPHLNHMSSDICRGLLEFGEGKPLGETGLRWLKIHLANKMGKDKLSMDLREQYTDSIIPLIEKVVADPLANREWLEVEDSWQTLAAMYEVHEALKSGDPKNFVSHMHIHQDGSCNGLQHYAALGRDFDGAYQVNLVKRDTPGDLYTHIANMIEDKLKLVIQDSSDTNYEMAKKLSGNVKRKIIKQTVMTTVYGVTFLGARKQIQKQLRDKDFIDQENDSESFQASKYLANLTLECVANLFTQAHEIKQWLKDCAKTVTEFGFPMSWMTPLGLPVIQPYRTTNSSEVVETLLQSIVVNQDNEEVIFSTNLRTLWRRSSSKPHSRRTSCTHSTPLI